MQLWEIYIGNIEFHVILNLKNSILITRKCLSINFLYNFIQSTFHSYHQKCESLIPNWLFEEIKEHINNFKFQDLDFAISFPCLQILVISFSIGIKKVMYFSVISPKEGNCLPSASSFL